MYWRSLQFNAIWFQNHFLWMFLKAVWGWWLLAVVVEWKNKRSAWFDFGSIWVSYAITMNLHIRWSGAVSRKHWLLKSGRDQLLAYLCMHSNSRDGDNDNQLQFKAEPNTVSSIALFGGKTQTTNTRISSNLTIPKSSIQWSSSLIIINGLWFIQMLHFKAGIQSLFNWLISSQTAELQRRCLILTSIKGILILQNHHIVIAQFFLWQSGHNI